MKFLSQLKTSQNKVLGILQFKHRESRINDLYMTIGALKLTDIQKYSLLTIMHKFMHTPDVFPAALKDLLIQHSEIDGYNTRNKYDLHATLVNAKIYSHKKLSYITRRYLDKISQGENSYINASALVCTTLYQSSTLVGTTLGKELYINN